MQGTAVRSRQRFARTGARMKPLRLLVSLPNRNHYQQEKAKAAINRASQLGAEGRVLVADTNRVTQSRKVLEALPVHKARPDAVLVEPLTSTAMVKAAEAAVAAGVG